MIFALSQPISMAFRKCRQKIRKWNSEKVKFQSELTYLSYAVLGFYIEEVGSYTESSCAAMLFAAEQVDLNEFIIFQHSTIYHFKLGA